MCIEIFKLDNKKIGGNGHIFEIDKSKFAKLMFNRGKLTEGKWVLGAFIEKLEKFFYGR